MPASIDEKIITLQEKVLYQEDTLQKLDDVIAGQYKLMDSLTRRVNDLEMKLEALQEEWNAKPVAAVDEKPPHY